MCAQPAHGRKKERGETRDGRRETRGETRAERRQRREERQEKRDKSREEREEKRDKRREEREEKRDKRREETREREQASDARLTESTLRTVWLEQSAAGWLPNPRNKPLGGGRNSCGMGSFSPWMRGKEIIFVRCAIAWSSLHWMANLYVCIFFLAGICEAALKKRNRFPL